jgi:uncharacterized OB-fold protein
MFSTDWGIEGGQAVLYGGSCTACAGKFFPNTKRCPVCLSEQVERIRLSREGKLYSFSVVRVDSSGMRAPYTIGYVDLFDGPRVFAHIAGREDEPLKPDATVQLTYGPLPLKNQETVLTYKFEPRLRNGQRGSQL